MTTNVLIINRILAHYRSGIYFELQRDKRLNVSFASGNDPRGSIKEISTETLDCYTRLRNRHIGPFLWQSGLLFLVSRTSADFVILEGDAKYLSNWLAVYILRYRRKKVFFWTTGWLTPDPVMKRFVRVLYYRTAHHLLLYGDLSKSIALTSGIKPSSMTVVYNSLDIPRSSSTKSTDLVLADLGSHGPFVGAVIRLNESKNLASLILAASLSQFKPTVLLVGDGPDSVRLVTLANRLNVKLILTGALYEPTQLRSIYDLLHVTIIPRGGGLSVTQSMAYCVPVITSRDDNFLTESEAIQEGINGDFYTGSDVGDLVRVMDKWLGMSESDYQGAQKACEQEFLTRWTPKAQSERIISALLRYSL